MTTGEKLIKLRNERKLSQKQLADELGVHLNTYSRVERGVNKPSGSLIEKLALFFGTEKSQLTDDDPKEDTGKDVKEAAVKGVEPEAVTAEADSEKTDAEHDALKKDTAKEDSEIFVELQYAGKAISCEELVKRAREAAGIVSGKLDIYVKPEENRVYYVAGRSEGSFEI